MNDAYENVAKSMLDAAHSVLPYTWEQAKQELTRQLVQFYITQLRKEHGNECIITVEVTQWCHDEQILSATITHLAPQVTYTIDIDLSKLTES